MVWPLPCLTLSLPCFSPSLNKPGIFLFSSFRALALTFSSFYLEHFFHRFTQESSYSDREKKSFLREVFHDIPVYKIGNPFPYPTLYILMYFFIAHTPPYMLYFPTQIWASEPDTFLFSFLYSPRTWASAYYIVDAHKYLLNKGVNKIFFQ